MITQIKINIEKEYYINYKCKYKYNTQSGYTIITEIYNYETKMKGKEIIEEINKRLKKKYTEINVINKKIYISDLNKKTIGNTEEIYEIKEINLK